MSLKTWMNQFCDKPVTKGQTAYILSRDNNGLKITEKTITCVGRNYITVSNFQRFTYVDYQSNYLIEDSSTGWVDRLYFTKEEAAAKLKTENLIQYLRTHLECYMATASLKRLEAATGILSGKVPDMLVENLLSMWNHEEENPC